MNVLFLDDDAGRHATFRRRADPLVRRALWDRVDVCFDARQAVARLDEGAYDLIFLDHDLSEEAEGLVLDGAEDGRFVARHLAEHAGAHGGAAVVVHSLNPVGARAMVDILRAAGFQAMAVPFAWRTFRWLDGTLSFAETG